MAYCDNCGNFDDSHFEDLKETYQQMPKDAHQPDLYYYWDAPLEEDQRITTGVMLYQMLIAFAKSVLTF